MPGCFSSQFPDAIRTVQASNMQTVEEEKDEPTHHVHELLNNQAAILADVLSAL